MDKLLTWEDFRKKAEDNGFEYQELLNHYYKLFGWINEIGISFYRDGDIFIDNTCIARNRTPDQMYTIMEALK